MHIYAAVRHTENHYIARCQWKLSNFEETWQGETRIRIISQKNKILIVQNSGRTPCVMLWFADYIVRCRITRNIYHITKIPNFKHFGWERGTGPNLKIFPLKMNWIWWNLMCCSILEVIRRHSREQFKKMKTKTAWHYINKIRAVAGNPATARQHAAELGSVFFLRQWLFECYLLQVPKGQSRYS